MQTGPREGVSPVAKNKLKSCNNSDHHHVITAWVLRVISWFYIKRLWKEGSCQIQSSYYYVITRGITGLSLPHWGCFQ